MKTVPRSSLLLLGYVVKWAHIVRVAKSQREAKHDMSQNVSITAERYTSALETEVFRYPTDV